MSGMTTVFSQALKILDFWKEGDPEWLNGEELWRRKELLRKTLHPPSISRKSKREFSRYLAELAEHKFLWRRWNSEEWCYYYAKVDEAHRRSFASIFFDFAESGSICETRDVLGASVIYSKPALSDFMNEKQVQNIYFILNGTNSKIEDRIVGLLQKRKDASAQHRDPRSYATSVRKHAEMAERLRRSGKVETQKEDKKTLGQLLAEAKLRDCDTVEKLRKKVGWHFSRMMKDYPLTFDEYKEYQRLSTIILPVKKSLLDIEEQTPKFLCCFWNFEMEEYFLDIQNLVLCVDDIVRSTEKIIESMSRPRLLEYRQNIEKALRSGTFHMPLWTGSDKAYQPKLRPSWNDRTARKYLKGILMSIDHWLSINKERK